MFALHQTGSPITGDTRRYRGRFTSITIRPMGAPFAVMSKKTLGLAIFSRLRRRRSTERFSGGGITGGHKEPKKMEVCGLILYKTPGGGAEAQRAN